MKKFVILLTVALLLTIAFPALAVDWTFSGWAHSENTIGENVDWSPTLSDGKTNNPHYLQTNDDPSEYALEARFTVNAKIDDQHSFLYQIRTKGFYNDGGWSTGTSGDGVVTRLAYATWKPSDKLSIVAGKNAYWLASGLLMDDFVRGVNLNYQLTDKTSLFGLIGRYESGLSTQIYAGALNTNLGGVDLGLTVLGSNDTIQGGAKGLANATSDKYDGTLIYAIHGGKNIAEGLNLSAAYAVNSKAEDAWKTARDKDENSAYKVQLGYGGIKNLGLYLQYFQQDAFMMWPTETGNHMGWWGDMYSAPTGIHGFRLIGEYKVSDYVGLTLAHGSYKLNDSSYNDDTFTKTTLELTIGF
ncbi:hypothetical protein EDC14_100111 [Hydrogenispora ethanolica]|jgi:hypothetical protein|uniref:Porin n=1 Tax=Hydrogenispora ethanolica TaxID=1082276 RepID=A0A4R1SB65_HYDET|nr:hypothetical protein [Hydrogenispora ethanolica]TCL76731.1 hypothetical protein EDC14_100111 [Hydrogenispora ethanolica]